MKIELERNYNGSPTCARLDIGEVAIVFSYSTPIAVRGPRTSYKWIVTENRWNQTTARHMTALGEAGKKENRYIRGYFEAALQAELDSLNTPLEAIEAIV